MNNVRQTGHPCSTQMVLDKYEQGNVHHVCCDILCGRDRCCWSDEELFFFFDMFFEKCSIRSQNWMMLAVSGLLVSSFV